MGATHNPTAAPESGLMTSVSGLVGTSVVDAAGQVCGRVHEFVVDVERDAAHVSVLILRRLDRGKRKTLSVPIQDIEPPRAGQTQLKVKAQPKPAGEIHDLLLLERDLLDQQIIDVDGHKVVRVNDVNLTWEPIAGTLGLRVSNVEVGLRGRREGC